MLCRIGTVIVDFCASEVRLDRARGVFAGTSKSEGNTTVTVKIFPACAYLISAVTPFALTVASVSLNGSVRLLRIVNER